MGQLQHNFKRNPSFTLNPFTSTSVHEGSSYVLGTRAAEAAAITQLPVSRPGHLWWTRGLGRASVAISSDVAAIAFLQQLLVSVGLCLTGAHYFYRTGEGRKLEAQGQRYWVD